MAKQRVIPKILAGVRESADGPIQIAVRTRGFDQRLPVGTPTSQARILQGAQADEIMLLFIDRQMQWIPAQAISLTEAVCEELQVPLTVGGSIETFSQAAALLRSGADRVCIGYRALSQPALVSAVAEAFGAQAVVVSVDFRRCISGGQDAIQLRDGAEVGVEDVPVLIEHFAQRGAGQIHFHDMSRDGSRSGLDIPLMKQMLPSAHPVPLVLSGGCGSAHHFIDAFRHLRVSGVAAGSFFATRDQGPMQVRAQARNLGVESRRLYLEG